MQQHKEDIQALYRRQQKAARRLVRTSQILFACIASLTILYWFFIPALKKGIKEWVYYQSQGVYSLDIEDLFIDWRDGSLLLKNINLQTDSSRWQKAIEVHHTQPMIQSRLAWLRIEDIDWWRYWRHDSLFIRKISIQGGDIHWQQQGSRSSNERKLNYYRLTRAFFESVSAVTPSLRLGELAIDGLSLQLKIAYDTGIQKHRLGELSAKAHDIVVERGTLHSPLRPFFARYATFRLGRYEGHSSGNVVQIKSLYFDTRYPNLYMLAPSFRWKSGAFKATQLHIKGIHWTALFFERRLHLRTVLLQTPQLKLSSSGNGNISFLSQKAHWKRRLPVLSKQWFDEVLLDSLQLSDGSILLPEGSIKGIKLHLYGFSPAYSKQVFFCRDILLSVKDVRLFNGKTHVEGIQLQTRRRHLSVKRMVHEARGQKVKLSGLYLSPHLQHYWNSDELHIGLLRVKYANIELQSNQNNKSNTWKRWLRRLTIQQGGIDEGNLTLWTPSPQGQLSLEDYHLRFRHLQLPALDSLPAWQQFGRCVEDFRARRLSFESDSLQWGMRDLQLLSDTMGMEARKLYFASPALAASLPVLYVPGWQWHLLWKEKRIHADTLRLTGLEVYLSPRIGQHAADGSPAGEPAPARQIAQWIQKNQWKLSIRHLHLSAPALYWLPSPSLPVEGEIRALSFHADSLYIEDSLDVLTNSFLARQFRLKTQKSRFLIKDEAELHFDSLTIDKQGAWALLHRMRLTAPAQSLRMVQGRMHGIAWDSLWQAGKLHAHKLAFIRPQIEATGKQQQEAVSLPRLHRLHLDTLLVSNADLLWQQEEQQVKYRVQHANLLTGPVDGRFLLPDSLSFLRCTARSFFRLSPHDTLSFAHMQWDAKGSGLRLRDIQWRMPHVRAYLPYLYVQHINLPKLIHGDSLLLRRLRIGNASVRIEHDRWAEAVLPQDNQGTSLLSFLRIDSLQINNSRLLFHVATASGITKHDLQGIELYVQQLTHHGSQTVPGSDFSLAVKRYDIAFPDPLYHLSLRDIRLQSNKPAVQLGSMAVFSSVNTDDLWKQRLYTKTILQARLQDIRMPYVPWDALFKGQAVYIPRLQVKSWQLAAIDDLRLAKNPLRRPPMPHELLQSTRGSWLIDTIVFENGLISYEQKQWNNVGNGRLNFNQVHLQLYHVGNRRDSLPLRLEMASLFMNQGVLALNMDVDRHSPRLHATYAGTLGRMSAIYLNRMLEPAAQVRLQTGIIKKITFKGKMLDYSHRGEMLAVYRNFKVSVLDAQAKRKRRIVSKLVNMLIRNTNRRKTGSIYYNRLPSDGFLRILWQGLASGLRDTLLPEIMKGRE